MSRLRPHLRLLTWLTLMVIGLGVLAPTVVQALAAPPTLAHWQDICTASGIVRLDATPPADNAPQPASAPADEGGAYAGKVCLGCLLHGLGLALSPGPSLVWPAPLAITGLPPVQGTAPAPATAVWLVPPAPAPPPQS